MGRQTINVLKQLIEANQALSQDKVAIALLGKHLGSLAAISWSFQRILTEVLDENGEARPEITGRIIEYEDDLSIRTVEHRPNDSHGKYFARFEMKNLIAEEHFHSLEDAVNWLAGTRQRWKPKS